MLKERKKTPFQFWLIDGTQFPNIRSIALRLFSVVPSSAASERNFSTFGFVHSKVQKLVYIKTNAPQFTDSKYVPDEDGTDDDEF